METNPINMIERLEDFHWYKGLYGEVVEEDTYGLRGVSFQPDVIFDLGANVGIFTRFARELFPAAHIIAVEPNPENCELFRHFTDMTNITLIQKAIGVGKVSYRDCTDGVYSYMSEGGIGPMQETDVETIMISDLIEESLILNRKVLLKMDVEGGENYMFDKAYEWELLRQIDHVAIEFHWSVYHNLVLDYNDFTKVYSELSKFYETHNYTIKNESFIAKRKGL